MKMFFLLQGEKVAEGRGRMRGPFVRRSRARQNKFKSTQDPPIDEAGECRGHCEGAEDGKRDAGLSPSTRPLPLSSSRPAAGSDERVRKSHTGTHNTRTCALPAQPRRGAITKPRPNGLGLDYISIFPQP